MRAAAQSAFNGVFPVRFSPNITSTMAFCVAQKALRAPVPTARRGVAVVGRPARSLVIRAAAEPKVQPASAAC